MPNTPRSATDLRQKVAHCIDLAAEKDRIARTSLVRLAVEFEEQAMAAEVRDSRWPIGVARR